MRVEMEKIDRGRGKGRLLSDGEFWAVGLAWAMTMTDWRPEAEIRKISKTLDAKLLVPLVSQVSASDALPVMVDIILTV